MFVGFDYGSANCAIGMIKNDQIHLLPLTEKSPYLSSTLYAYHRDLICEAVYQNLPEPLKLDYAKSRALQLAKSKIIRRELDLRDNEPAVFFGEEALNAYLDMPEEGFYVRSPKSFLGATGLRKEQIALFEDIVTLMMQHIKSTAELALVKTALKSESNQISYAVIGRPVNFQGLASEDSNRQAEQILTTAAKRANFKEVSFLFEPLAAAMDFETQLEEDKTVLVVDVGGGTTDCSMVKMGPSYRYKNQREEDFLSHSGQRIGGNDLDIALAMTGFMPSMGLKSTLNTGKPIPSKPFWNAVAVNDLSAQKEFAALETKKLIEDLIRDANQPKQLLRLLKVQQHQLGYELVRNAENAKILLTDNAEIHVELSFIEKELLASIDTSLFALATDSALAKVQNLMQEAVLKAKVQPNMIYVTGGTAKSPAVYNKIAEVFPNCPIIMGDNFGSVTAGLTHWAQKHYSNKLDK